jgi:DNA polymerase V
VYLWSDYRTEKTICLAVSPSLKAYGIGTMGKIAHCSIEDEELLYQLFGVNAELLIDHAWG